MCYNEDIRKVANMKNISIVILFIATLGFVLFLSNNRYNDNVSIISNLEAKVVALTEENIMLDLSSFVFFG